MPDSAPSVASLERTDAPALGAPAVPLRFFGPGCVLAFVAVTTFVGWWMTWRRPHAELCGCTERSPAAESA